MNEIRVLEEDEFLCDYDAEEEKEIYEDNEMLVETATQQNFPSLWEICNSKIQIILYE